MKRITLLTALCLAVAGGGLAQAQTDAKSYAPGYCQKTLTGPVYGQPDVFNFASGYTNVSGSPLVTCPIIKDNQNTNGLGWAIVNVYNTGGELSCTIYSIGESGETLDFRIANTQLTGNQRLYLYPYPSTSAVLGTYSIICNLPPESQVRNYTIYEN